MNNNIKIICDSLSDVNKEYLQQYDIDVVPLTLILNGKEYRDGIDIEPEEFYKILREENAHPKTSQATYAQFKEVFDKYTKEGKTILYISGSAAATGTCQSAIMAKNDIEGDIYIYDTNNLTFGSGFFVVKAAEMIKEGKTIEEVFKALDEIKEKYVLMFTVDTLEYLKKGGRISNGKALVGNMLSLRPMLTVRDGLIFQEGQVRGNKKIVPTIIKRTKEVCGEDFSDRTIAIGCGDNLEDREQLKEAVLRELNPKELILITINPPMCSHSGPGFIGLTCFR